ncbi:hypothetical protein [Flavobacterium fluviatile]|uniref:hypothetical protein n=1 Tax=Flavobacterium fluviatile TaxID=1862387 RepID=UPI0013CFAA30|nr:hypothetical protein [Flavobacterium fluviatile]
MKTKLTQATPKLNVILWYLGSFFYALSIFINENRGTISELGLTYETESRIKIAGIILYFLFTYFNFNQIQKPKKP